MHKIGVLKEIKNFESRVGLSPDGVKSLTETGLEVFVESSAGTECNFSDEQYSNCGAIIVPSAEKLVKNADLLVKVLPLSPVEEELIDNSHIIFSFLKLSPKTERLKSLMDKKFTYFAADLLEDQKGIYTVLEAMSEVAGRMASADAYSRVGVRGTYGQIHFWCHYRNHSGTGSVLSLLHIWEGAGCNRSIADAVREIFCEDGDACHHQQQSAQDQIHAGDGR